MMYSYHHLRLSPQNSEASSVLIIHITATGEIKRPGKFHQHINNMNSLHL